MKKSYLFSLLLFLLTLTIYSENSNTPMIVHDVTHNGQAKKILIVFADDILIEDGEGKCMIYLAPADTDTGMSLNLDYLNGLEAKKEALYKFMLSEELYILTQDKKDIYACYWFTETGQLSLNRSHIVFSEEQVTIPNADVITRSFALKKSTGPKMLTGPRFNFKGVGLELWKEKGMQGRTISLDCEIDPNGKMILLSAPKDIAGSAIEVRIREGLKSALWEPARDHLGKPSATRVRFPVRFSM